MSNTPEQLAQFQAALLDLLDQPISGEAIHEALQTRPEFAAYRDYIETFEPRMLEVAAELTKKWGVKVSPR